MNPPSDHRRPPDVPQGLRSTRPVSAVKNDGHGVPVPANPASRPRVEQPANEFGSKSGFSTDLLVQSVGDLVTESITAANYESERKKAQKRADATSNVVKRTAQVNSNFPTTYAFYRQMKSEEDAEKAHMDEAVKKQSVTVGHITDGLKSCFEPIYCQYSKIEETIANLRAEFDEKNRKVRSDFQEENAKLRFELSKWKSEGIVQDNKLKRLEGEFSAARNSSQKEVLERIKALENTVSRCSAVQNTLNAVQNTLDTTLNRVTKLEKELHSNSTLQNRVLSLEKSMNVYGSVQSLAMSLEERVNGHSESIDALSTRYEGLQESFESSTKDEAEGANSQPPQFSEQIGRKVYSVSDDVDSLFSSLRTGFRRIDQIEGIIGKYEAKLNLIDGLADKVAELQKSSVSLGTSKTFHSRLVAIENRNSRAQPQPRSSKPENSAGPDLAAKTKNIELRLKALEEQDNNDSLDKRILDLDNRIDGMVKVQAMSDDMSLSQVEDIKKQVEQASSSLRKHAEEISTLAKHTGEATSQITTLKNDCASTLVDCNRISQEMRTHQSGTNPDSKADMKKLDHGVEAVTAAVRRLETRYNSLTTEPIVRSMVQAMNEMYPSAGQLIEQVASLRSHVDSDLRARISMVLESIDQQKQRVDMAFTELRALEEAGDTTTRRLDSLVKETDQQNRTRSAEHDSLLQSLNTERRRLSGEVESLGKELKSLVDGLGAGNTPREHELKELSERVGSICGRLTQLENAQGPSNLRRGEVTGSNSNPVSALDSDSEAEPQPQKLLETFVTHDRGGSDALQRNGDNNRKRPSPGESQLEELARSMFTRLLGCLRHCKC